jgi:predicted metal-dependent hydrolase
MWKAHNHLVWSVRHSIPVRDRDWIDRYGELVADANISRTDERMNEPEQLPLGVPVPPRVEVRRSARRRRTVTAYRERDAIVVLVPQRMSRTEERAFVDDLVRKVLAREARAAARHGDGQLIERARQLAQLYLAPRLGEAPEPRMVGWVTNQQRRWGSCTPATRAIRLSHRLRPMPAWVIDYVLIHELAHLVEPTHSAAFWRLVAGYADAERAKGYLEGYLAGQGIPLDEAADAD